MLNSNSELKELKSLLFEDEIDSFHQLQKQIESLRLEQHSIEEIVEKIKPLLDGILLERLSDDQEVTVDIYAAHIAKIIQKSTKQHLPALSKALQPVISPAISKEIEDNKEKMVDALYPIMGGMISKYVSNAIAEMMEKINSKVEEGLSFNSYKRKIKAKVSGVSESELLIEESNQAMIRALFVIDKESALLIAEEHIENQEIDDPYMVASMASAIKDFVNDWIANHEEHSEVQLLSYGNETLYIESAGSVYLIAFLDAEPDHEQRREIQEFFAKIVKQYSTFFQNFDGDDSSQEAREIKKQMQDFLHQQQSITDKAKGKKSSNFAKILLFIFGALCMIYIGFMAKERYSNYQIEQSVLEQTGEEISLSTRNGRLHVDGHIKSLAHYNAIEKIINNKADKKIVNDMYLRPEALETLMKQLNNLKTEVLEMKKHIKLKEKIIND